MSRWFRMYDALLDDPKVQRLPAELFRVWVNILCLASRNAGALPSVDDISFALRKTVEQTVDALSSLSEAGLLDEGDDGASRPHNWDKRQHKGDVSTERVKQFRKRSVKRDETVSGNANETVPRARVTDTDTDTDSVANATGGEPPNSYPADPVERLWAEGIDAMLAMGAMRKEAGSCIGRWLRDAKGDAVLVLGAIIQARAKGTRDPVALVSRILKPVQSNGTSEDKSVHRAARGLVERVQGFIDDAEPAVAFGGQQSGGAALRLLPERRG